MAASTSSRSPADRISDTVTSFFNHDSLITDLSNNNCTLLNCSTGSTGDHDDDGVNLDADLTMQILYLSIGVFGIAGNTLVAGVLLHFRHLRKSLTNIFIINQSIIDGTASILIIVSSFVRDVNMISSPIGQELFCRLWLTNMPLWGIFVSSTYNMVAVTLERYYALVHPLKHQSYFTRKKAMYVIVFVWIFGPAFNSAYMIPTSGMTEQGTCSVFTNWLNTIAQTFTGVLTVILQYFLPLILVIYAYTRIAIVLTRAGAGKKKKEEGGESSGVSDNRDARMIRARKNVIKTLALVSFCFVFCWSWNQIFYTMFNCGYPVNFNSTFYHFTVIMVNCNCCLNPIAYAVKYEQFQDGVKKIFCKSCIKDNTMDNHTFSNVSTISGSAQSVLSAGQSNSQIYSLT